MLDQDLPQPSAAAGDAAVTGPLDPLRGPGFVYLTAEQSRAMLQRFGATDSQGWAEFAASWNGMAMDRYMADGGRYRRRRHGVFATRAGQPGVTRQPDAPHYQTLDHNHLNGGVARHFEPMATATAEGPVFQGLLAWTRGIFDRLSPGTDWHIEAHQFRIEAAPGQPGQPTPEGVHRDGVDWVMVLMVHRNNVASGVTSIQAPDGTSLGSFTLTKPFDAVLVDDHKVMHGVTAVQPLDASLPAWRDVLVLTYRRV